MMNKTIGSMSKDINKNKNLRQTINNPLISHLREEILNTKKETYADQTLKSHRNLKENKVKLNTNLEKYSGFVLLKFDEGEIIKEIKLEGDLEHINNIFSREKIEINNREVEFVFKDEYERIRKENEKIQNEFLKLKDEYDKQRDRDLLNTYENEKKEKEENVNLIAKMKKSVEEENNYIEEDNLKIKEIKDRINKYKEELKKGNNNDFGKNERMSCRLKNNKKESFNIDQKMKELEIKKNKLKEENKIKEYKDINIPNNDEIKREEKIKTELKNDISQNENMYKKINAVTEKKENNIKIVSNEKTEKKDNKEKDKIKGYSKALDRFKKRYKKDNSMEVRNKKSDKIGEIAKKLENIMARQQSAEYADYKKIESDEKNQEQNPVEIINNQQITKKNVKKPHKPQL